MDNSERKYIDLAHSGECNGTIEGSLNGLSSRLIKLGRIIAEQSEIPFIDGVRRRESRKL